MAEPDGDVSDACLKDEHENCNMEDCMCSCHEEG